MNTYLVTCLLVFLAIHSVVSEIHSGHNIGEIDINNNHGLTSNTIVDDHLKGVAVKGGFGSGLSSVLPGGLTGGNHFQTVTQNVPVPIPQPYPVIVNRPVQVPVPQPYPVVVSRPVPVQVTRTVPVPVPQPYRVPVQVPVQVPVPQPYPVSVPQPYPVRIPQTILVPVPQPVNVGGNFRSSDFGGVYGGGFGGYGKGFGEVFGGYAAEGKGSPSYSYTTVQVGSHSNSKH
ncbi:unnamed protein product [Phaedon cochleariae]|uniref:Uncharacterized protein n=1 Tax=Phaedon cochleariae TaxID=80249 RepID=A0A9N9X492_PHACE|nr:unnamed protein product [Phaedon cochleariae]